MKRNGLYRLATVALIAIFLATSPYGLNISAYPEKTNELAAKNSLGYPIAAEGLTRLEELPPVFETGFGRSEGPSTIIVTTDRAEYGEPFTTKLAVWLQAVFSAEVRIIGQNLLSQVSSAGLLEEAEVIIYYGIDYNQPPPDAFISQVFRMLENQLIKLVWLGYHCARLDGYLDTFGLSYRGPTESSTRPANLFYVDTESYYDIFNRDILLLDSWGSNLARPRATVKEEPVVVSARHGTGFPRGPRFYFFGFHPTSFLTSGGAHLIFLDLMHEIYDIKRSKHALVRLEDVSPSTEPRQLATVTKYLCENNRYFTYALVPFYIGTDLRFIPLREKVDLLEVIKESLNCGAEIVLHGATHQYQGETGVDSEFWDENKDVPIEDINYIRSRVELALAEVEATGLLSKTVGWETPHNPYHASEKAFDYFESQFELLYEDPHWEYDLHLLPYPLIRKSTTYVQTNLGYYQLSLPSEQIETKLQQAEKVNNLQHGGIASFFYHPWLGLEKLQLIIEGLAEQGWEFSPVSSVATEYSTVR